MKNKITERREHRPGRVTVEIAKDKWQHLRQHSMDTGLKMYVLIDDVLEAGMKRKRLLKPDGEEEATADLKVTR